MTRVRTMLSLAEDYLVERRAEGFEIGIGGEQIKAFGRFVDETGDTGPLTTRLTLDCELVPVGWTGIGLA